MENASEPVGYSSAGLMGEIPRQVFNGATIETQEPETPPESPETLEAPEAPPETPTGEGEGLPETPPEEIPEGWEFKPKYKDHKAAEEGAREHQRKVTEATEETKKEREAREATERELTELRQKLADQDKAKPPEKPAETTKTPEELETEQEARIEAALSEISNLEQPEYDPDDPDPDYAKKLANYHKQVAKAWRKVGIGGTGQPAIPNGEALQEIIDRRVEERLQAREQARVQETAADAKARIWNEATDFAAKAGLDMSEDSADAIIFEKMAKKIPKDLDSKPLQEQVDWVVGEVRKRTGKVVQMTDAEREKARKAQANNAVLERGNNRPAPNKKPDNEEPYTTASLLREVQEGRRIQG